MEGAFGRQATNPRSAPRPQGRREADSGIRGRIPRISLLFSFWGPSILGSLKVLPVEASERVSGRAYSSVGLERTPDKREVGGSNPPRPTIFRHRFVGL